MKRAAGLFLLLASVPACVSTLPEPPTRIPPEAVCNWNGQPAADPPPYLRSLPTAPPVDEPRPPSQEPTLANGELPWKPSRGVTYPTPLSGDPAAAPSGPPQASTSDLMDSSLVTPAKTRGYDEKASAERTAANPPPNLTFDPADARPMPPPPSPPRATGRYSPETTIVQLTSTPRFESTVTPKPEPVVTPRSEPTVAPKPERNVVQTEKKTTAESEMGSHRPHAGSPIVRLVNSKRITVNFEVKDVGPSGVAAVDLWYTRDCKTWRKHEGPPQGSSYVFQVPEEGMYGFTLVAKSGVGIAKDPPVSGDMPQLWVVVDLTKPRVQLLDVATAQVGKERTITVRWKATDPNLGRRSISLSYADKESGPWMPIANNLENNGSYAWTPPASAPATVLLRVEATDLAGNVGQATSSQAILLDTAKPLVEIVDAEPGN